MKSFRTEFEEELQEVGNALVERDIIELEKKIQLFQTGKIDEERFRTLRLARGVYGQRQSGAQMIRIKIPYGKLNARQLERIAKVSDEYSNGNLHITTRQDIQIHHVDLNRTPELWSELEKDEITLREACGNTVRNVTASALSGIDPSEIFDVRAYADAVFKYFLRNPICQEMGRKIKFAFSNSIEDTALTYMHDLGFIAQIKDDVKGFKVVVAGGLGSQPREADVLFDFIPANKVIPISEALLRLFDRNGERSNRMKARLKFWVKDVGVDFIREEILKELKSIPHETINIDYFEFDIKKSILSDIVELQDEDSVQFEKWKNSNVYEQKQNGLFAVATKIRLGNFSSDQARSIADFVKSYSGDEITFTIDQNLIIRHVVGQQLPRFFYLLKELQLDDLGVSGSHDITACPGTDTCNLGIANSTDLSRVLEDVLRTEYPQYQDTNTVSIKISGCMNSCGQHMISPIGFQGMTINTSDKRVLPAVQVLLGGKNLGGGKGLFADKVIKIPSKRAPEALRIILNDFENSDFDEFVDFYLDFGKKYFYDLLKPLTDLENLTESDFMDWGQNEFYKKEIGIGECAGVVIDLVSSLFKESEEKLGLASEALDKGLIADSAYHSYSSIINSAKALLLSEKKRTNSHQAIIDQFQSEFIDSNLLKTDFNFLELVNRFKNEKPDELFAKEYIQDSTSFIEGIISFRENQLATIN